MFKSNKKGISILVLGLFAFFAMTVLAIMVTFTVQRLDFEKFVGEDAQLLTYAKSVESSHLFLIENFANQFFREDYISEIMVAFRSSAASSSKVASKLKSKSGKPLVQNKILVVETEGDLFYVFFKRQYLSLLDYDFNYYLNEKIVPSLNNYIYNENNQDALENILDGSDTQTYVTSFINNFYSYYGFSEISGAPSLKGKTQAQYLSYPNDYYLLYENGKIYGFPSKSYGIAVNGLEYLYDIKFTVNYEEPFLKSIDTFKVARLEFDSQIKNGVPINQALEEINEKYSMSISYVEENDNHVLTYFAKDYGLKAEFKK